MTRFLRLLPLVLAGLLAAAQPARAAEGRLLASPVRTFSGGARDPMLLPTSVAIDAAGRVWVADGTKDRVLVFAADGRLSQTVRKVAGQSLSRPMAIATTPDGRVWIADAGNARIAVTGADPAQERSLAVGKKLGRVDLTDLAVSPDGRWLFAVDNDGQRLVVADLPADRWETRGGKGTAWGNFDHPRAVAVDAEGRTFVTDVLNGRVARFDAAGRPMRPLGRYGAAAGQLYRPSGLDVEAGRVWVADAVLGVIQVFTVEGVLVDAVRDEQGRVLHLDGPLGIEVLGERLLVVESKGGQVKEFAVRGGGGEPLRAIEVRTAGASASQARECTLCHLEFLPPLDENIPTALTDVPPKRAGLSWVGTEDACISCHDGSVLDSRKHVWNAQGHPVDVALPAKMAVPASLPLVDGKIACRTCHTAHTMGGSGKQHREALMLRVGNRPSELCVACHGDMGGGQ